MIQFLKGCTLAHPTFGQLDISPEEMFNGYEISNPKTRFIRPNKEATLTLNSDLMDSSLIEKCLKPTEMNSVNIVFKQKVYCRRHKKKRINKKLEKKFGKKYIIIDEKIADATIKQIYGDQIEFSFNGRIS